MISPLNRVQLKNNKNKIKLTEIMDKQTINKTILEKL